MTGQWPPALAFFGLHVDFGRWHHDAQKWLRLPTASITCRHGCEWVAVGAADVAHLTQNITAEHARSCPGPDQRNPA